MKMYNFFISVGAVVLATTASVSSLATDKQVSAIADKSQTPPLSQPQQNSALQQLREKLAKYDKFSAQFTQTVFDAKGAQIQVSEGEMQVCQPNKFRWKTYEPDENLIISDGDAVWIYNTFVEQVTAMELDQTVQQSPLWLIANQSDESWSQFNVSHSQHGYSIVPNDPNSLTRQIVIRFNDSSISQLVIEDSQGQSSEFNLSQFNAKPGFDNNLFIFEMPQGVDFDDQREAK